MALARCVVLTFRPHTLAMATSLNPLASPLLIRAPSMVFDRAALGGDDADVAT